MEKDEEGEELITKSREQERKLKEGLGEYFPLLDKEDVENINLLNSIT